MLPGRLSPQDLELLAQDELSNMSGGYGDYNDDELSFDGIEASFAQEIKGGRIYKITVVNSATDTRTMKLTPGLVYVQGSEADGVIKTGAFDDTAGLSGLSATGSPQSVEMFLAWITKKPQRFGGFKVRSTVEAQLDEIISISRENPYKSINTDPMELPIGAFTDENQFNSKVATINFDGQFDEDIVITFPVVGSSTLTLTIFNGTAYDKALALKRKAARGKSSVIKRGVSNVNRATALKALKLKSMGISNLD